MKKKMAFVDLTNFKDWPMGGMLEYERSILKHLIEEFDVDLWGVSVDGEVNKSLVINGQEYPIHIYGNAKTKGKIIPNYWRGLELYFSKKDFPKDYDVVYAHTGSCLVAANRMIDKKRTKLVYHQHGLNHHVDYSLMSLIQRPGLSMAQKAANLVFVVSDEESVRKNADEMKKKTAARFVPIGSPLSLDCYNTEAIHHKISSREGDETTRFIYTGRLSAFKDVKTLIEAMRIYIKEKCDKATLKIVGTGSEFDNLQKMIIEYHLENNVEILRAVPHEQVYELLLKSDVFLTASGGEGVSVSVLEAYASGLPVVCFKVPGLERQVLDGKTGVIAKERSARGFYEAMIFMNSKRTELAYNCLTEAKKYDSKSIAEIIADEIKQLTT